MRCQLENRVRNQSLNLCCECALVRSEFDVSFSSKHTRTIGQSPAMSYNITLETMFLLRCACQPPSRTISVCVPSETGGCMKMMRTKEWSQSDIVFHVGVRQDNPHRNSAH